MVKPPGMGLHGPVVVQMVLGQVGEHPRLEGQSLHPALGQGVGGDLHHHMGASRVCHAPQQRLELIGLRCSAVGRQLQGTDQIPVGANQAHTGLQRPFQHGLDKIGGGGLPVGAGDPDQGHLLPRVSEPSGGHPGQGGPGVWSGEPAPCPGRLPAQDGGGALFQRLGHIPVSVCLGP